MFTTPCCGQMFSGRNHRCVCGHVWNQQRMIQHGMIDEFFAFEELEDLAMGNVAGFVEAELEQTVFDNFGF